LLGQDNIFSGVATFLAPFVAGQAITASERQMYCTFALQCGAHIAQIVQFLYGFVHFLFEK